MSRFLASSSALSRLSLRPASSTCLCLTVSPTFPRRRPLHTSASTSDQDASAKSSNSKAYHGTLHLPKTAFPLRADAASRERLFTERMTEELYQWQWDQKERPLFVLHDGPPYANGNLHIGHALNKILKDVINRYKVARGYRVHYRPGFDCHGLPIEHKALQQLEADHREMSPLEVRKVARKTAQKAIAVQKKEFKSFALMCDWDQVYQTFDKEYEVRQLRVFQEMVQKGQIFRAVKPVLWSPSSRTALAEAEISYKDDHVSESVFVRFRIMELGRTLPAYVSKEELHRVNLVIWTTTPWTLPANRFMAYSPTLEYCLGRCRDSRELVIVAANRVDYLSKTIGQEIEILYTALGDKLLSGVTYCPPFQEWRLQEPDCGLPLLSAPYVTDESGTGLVHGAPAHGVEDYQVFKASPWGADQESLASPVNEDGLFTSQDHGFANPVDLMRLVGKSVLEDGSKEVITMLEERQYLVAKQKIRHKYPYDWKTKQPVIIRATPQWFASIDQIKASAVQALANDVAFVPEQGFNRLKAFVEGRSEWCISRQRAWGVPIPVVYEVHGGESSPLLSHDNIEHVIATLAEKGFDYWWEGPAHEFLPSTFERRPSMEYVKGTDTMDVWLDSGVSWATIAEELEQEGCGRRLPVADVYLEGSDQHRGWFQSSLLTSMAINGVPPFKNVITHGFVLDEKGVKMSKSVGNVISPLTVINGGKDKAKEPALGADTLRFWAASAGYTREVNISFGILASAAEGLRKIRNTARFILGNLASSELVAETSVAHSLSFADRFVLHELSSLGQQAERAYDGFQFNRAMVQLGNFCNTTLSSFYFDAVKDSLYADSPTSPRRQAIIFTLQQVLPVITSIASPVVPHLAEDIWEHWPEAMRQAKDNSSVSKQGWSSADPKWLNDKVANQMDLLRAIKSEVMVLLEQARKEKHIGSSSEAEVDVYVESKALSDTRTTLSEHSDVLNTLFAVSKVNLIQGESASSMKPGGTWEFSRKVEKQGVSVRARQSSLAKCPRCWLHMRETEEETCRRCRDVLSSK